MPTSQRTAKPDLNSHAETAINATSSPGYGPWSPDGSATLHDIDAGAHHGCRQRVWSKRGYHHAGLCFGNMACDDVCKWNAEPNPQQSRGKDPPPFGGCLSVSRWIYYNLSDHAPLTKKRTIQLPLCNILHSVKSPTCMSDIHHFFLWLIGPDFAGGHHL